MGKDSYIFYIDWIDVLLSLPDGLRLKVYDSIMKYMRDREQPCDSEVLYSPFGLIQRQIDRDEKKYKEKCAKRSEAGKKGNNVRWSQKQQSIAKIANAIIDSQKSQPLANIADNDNDNDNDNVNDNDNFPSKEEKLNIPPPPACAREENFFREYFAAESYGLRQRFIKNLHADNPAVKSDADLMEIAEDVMAEWQREKRTHSDYSDFVTHLETRIRIKNRSNRKQQQEQPPKSPLDEFIRDRLGYNPAELQS